MALRCIVFLLLFLATDRTSGARILGIFAHPGRSHFDVFEPLLKALAKRGHELTVVSHFPLKSPLANYTDISVQNSIPADDSPTVPVTPSGASLNKRFGNGPVMIEMAYPLCSHVLSSPEVQGLLTSDETFDLVITELFNADCFLALVHKFQAPHITMSSCALLAHHNDRFSNPDNPSYIPVVAEPSSGTLHFSERFLNTLHYLFYRYIVTFLFDWQSTYYARKHYNDSLPPLQDIARNTSLIFVNTHFTINRPRPLVPAVVEVAGIHLPSVKTLPKDIQEFLDGAEQGVIYFSMGSRFKAESFDSGTRQAFVEAFSELPQRVLWKWDGDLPGKSSNVMISKWVPQFDVLNHPKIKLYIGHGGQLGTVEAVHCAVPVIIIPMFADQDTNARHMEVAGMGMTLQYSDISKETVLNVTRTILTDPSYAENAKRVSRAFRDRPMSALDTAVYWTEYVIRHRGAHHLRSAAVELNIFQYLLLDVFAALFAVIGIIIYVMYTVTKKVFATCRRPAPRTNKKSNKKKTS